MREKLHLKKKKTTAKRTLGKILAKNFMYDLFCFVLFSTVSVFCLSTLRLELVVPSSLVFVSAEILDAGKNYTEAFMCRLWRPLTQELVVCFKFILDELNCAAKSPILCVSSCLLSSLSNIVVLAVS